MRHKEFYNWTHGKYELECAVEYEYFPSSSITAPKIALVTVAVETIHRFWTVETIPSEWLKSHPEWNKFLCNVVRHYLQIKLDRGGDFYRLLEDAINDDSFI